MLHYLKNNGLGWSVMMRGHQEPQNLPRWLVPIFIWTIFAAIHRKG